MSRTIAVAMSGGVDSSVAAAMLARRGERAFGVMLRLWSAGPDLPNRCCSPADLANARRVAAALDIPFYAIDAREPFFRQVVEPFVDGYGAGLTPNPCMNCNRHVRWGLMMDAARRMGADMLATGHYARKLRNNGRLELHRARDEGKDQSYVLSVLGQRDLERSMFPLGEVSKPQVRRMAAEFDLDSDRPDSQDLCFLGGEDYRAFLRGWSQVTFAPGPILSTVGDTVGEHDGLPAYTIGQRKGLGLSSSEPLYVVEKNTDTNAIVVGRRTALERTMFTIEAPNWVAGSAPQAEAPLSVQIRYRSTPLPCRLEGSTVLLEEPAFGITPGQAAVFYQGTNCLGGGAIAP